MNNHNKINNNNLGKQLIKKQSNTNANNVNNSNYPTHANNPNNSNNNMNGLLSNITSQYNTSSSHNQKKVINSKT
jgi:hypothetical protein